MNNQLPAELWRGALDRLRTEVGDANMDLWFNPKSVEPVALEDGLLCLRVPNKFFVEWIKDHYQRKIEACLATMVGSVVSLEYRVAKNVDQFSPAPDPIAVAPPQTEFAFNELNPRYTYDTFVVGPSNRLAHATAGAVSKSPGKQYNPFFLYGGVGLGKTHLMHAIGQALRKKCTRARVLYITSEQFVNEFINSLRDGKPDAFRSKYRNLDCLLIDDIQFLIGKGRSEEEFFHTYNALFDSRKQIVITSDRAPKEMAPAEARLISRFEWGMVADIKPPDLETRIAILRKKADAEQLMVPDDVILFLASAFKTNIRELEGNLIRLSALASLTGAHLTVDLAKEALKDALSADSADPVRIETIQRVVAQKYSLDVKELKSHSRTREIVFPRQVAIYLASKLTDMSTTEIGKAFGGRDHTTVIHARDKIAKMLEGDFLFVELVNRLAEQIKSVENL